MLVQTVNPEEKCSIVSFENDILQEKLKNVVGFSVKGKDENNCFQSEIKEELSKSQMNLLASFERNIELKRDLVKLKADPAGFLKWTVSSKDLDQSTNERPINDEGHGYQKKEDKKKVPYNFNIKYASDSTNLFRMHDSKNEHRKDASAAKCPTERKHHKCKESEKNTKVPGPISKKVKLHIRQRKV